MGDNWDDPGEEEREMVSQIADERDSLSQRIADFEAAVAAAIRGESVDEFMYSFDIVQRCIDLRNKYEEAEERANNLANMQCRHYYWDEHANPMCRLTGRDTR